jgi:hypothetical protein
MLWSIDSSTDLTGDYEIVTAGLELYGFPEVFRVLLSAPSHQLAVAKVAIIGSKLAFSHELVLAWLLSSSSIITRSVMTKASGIAD